MSSPDAMRGNVIQVRFQAIDYPSKGVFKVMTEQQVNDEFSGDGWVSDGVSTTMVGATTMNHNAFQIMTHHWTRGAIEAWYVTVHPAF